MRKIFRAIKPVELMRVYGVVFITIITTGAAPLPGEPSQIAKSDRAWFDALATQVQAIDLVMRRNVMSPPGPTARKMVADEAQSIRNALARLRLSHPQDAELASDRRLMLRALAEMANTLDEIVKSPQPDRPPSEQMAFVFSTAAYEPAQMRLLSQICIAQNKANARGLNLSLGLLIPCSRMAQMPPRGNVPTIIVPAGSPEHPVDNVTVVASAGGFSPNKIFVRVQSIISITLDNQVPHQPHTFSVYAGSDLTNFRNVVVQSDPVRGPAIIKLRLKSPKNPGVYTFVSNVHPRDFFGTIVVVR